MIEGERLRVALQNICSAELRIRRVIRHEDETGRRHHLKVWVETMEEGKHDMAMPGYLEPEMIASVIGDGRPQRGILGWVGVDAPRAVVRVFPARERERDREREQNRRGGGSDERAREPARGGEQQKAGQKLLADLCMVFEVAGGWRKKRLVLVFYYFPPNPETERIHSIVAALEELVVLLKKSAWVILVGDGNARRGEEVGDTKENSMGRELRALEGRQDLVRVKPEGTEQWTFYREGKGKSIPDHLSVQTEVQAILTRVKVVLDPTFGSDHRAIEFDLVLPRQEGERLEQTEPREFWNPTEEGSAEGRSFRLEVEQWAEDWLHETDRTRVDWKDARVTSGAYDGLCRRLQSSAERHIGEKRVWQKWGKSERARDLLHKLRVAGTGKAGRADEERKEGSLQSTKDYCADLHRETEGLRGQEERGRARAGEGDKYEHFRALGRSHWKRKKGTPGVVREGDGLVCDPQEGLRVWSEAMKKTMEASSEGLAEQPPPPRTRSGTGTGSSKNS